MVVVAHSRLCARHSYNIVKCGAVWGWATGDLFDWLDMDSDLFDWLDMKTVGAAEHEARAWG